MPEGVCLANLVKSRAISARSRCAVSYSTCEGSYFDAFSLIDLFLLAGIVCRVIDIEVEAGAFVGEHREHYRTVVMTARDSSKVLIQSGFRDMYGRNCPLQVVLVKTELSKDTYCRIHKVEPAHHFSTDGAFGHQQFVDKVSTSNGHRRVTVCQGIVVEVEIFIVIIQHNTGLVVCVGITIAETLPNGNVGFKGCGVDNATFTIVGSRDVLHEMDNIRVIFIGHNPLSDAIVLRRVPATCNGRIATALAHCNHLNYSIGADTACTRSCGNWGVTCMPYRTACCRVGWSNWLTIGVKGCAIRVIEGDIRVCAGKCDATASICIDGRLSQGTLIICLISHIGIVPVSFVVGHYGNGADTCAGRNFEGTCIFGR